MRNALAVTVLSLFGAANVWAQSSDADQSRGGRRSLREPHLGGSRNIQVVSHLPLGSWSSVMDIEVEQELSRPYAYVARADFLPLIGQKAADGSGTKGMDIISIKDLAHPKVLYSWRIENPELHRGPGSLAPTYIKTHGHYYFFNGFQFTGGGPDLDLGAIIWDVTSLPDTSRIKEVARIRVPEHPGGFHETFSYKHSNGEPLVVAQTVSIEAYLYDVDRIIAGDPNPVVSKISIPNWKEVTYTPVPRWHDFYMGYDPATHQDKFYGAGSGGGFVYDISNPAEPKLLASVTNMPGVTGEHTFTPTPDGRYAVVMPHLEDWYAPAKMVDLKPALEGKVTTISRPIGAWNASAQGIPHYSEVRWPYVFISGQTDGFQVINIMDPTNPYTVGFYSTRPGPYMHGVAVAGWEQTHAFGRGNSTYDGAWGIDVRNADGLIVVSDFDSGFWAFKLDGFQGWNGHQWGMPNVSSAQDWDNGPDGAPKSQKVS